MHYLRQHGTTVPTPQSEPMRPDQVDNSAGGYVWAVDCWTRLNRFLILGAEGGSYYAGEKELATQNVRALDECIREDGSRTVAAIRDVSVRGRARRNDEAVFALAACAGADDVETRRKALAALPAVCRTGTHLFQFVTYVRQFRGWGRALRRAVANWYASKAPNDLAYQLVKYRQREGVTHRDVLRLAHPARGVSSGNPEVPLTPTQERLLAWAAAGMPTDEVVRGASDVELPVPAVGYALAQHAMSPADTARIVRDYRLPREALNPAHLKSPDVWRALLRNDMPLTAMIRNLGNMTRAGVLSPVQEDTVRVVAALGDPGRIRDARVHPLTILVALSTYAAGHGLRGSGTWAPVPAIVDALDEAFYLAFENAPSTGKRLLVAIDISGSMDSGGVAGTYLTPRVAAAAMAMVYANREQFAEFVTFSCGGPRAWRKPAGQQRVHRFHGLDDGLEPFALSKRRRLDDVARETAMLLMGGTDCALPMLYATANRLEYDAFVILTDSETWAGDVHPAQALAEYRRKSGIQARLAVVGMVSNRFSIADPQDAGMLDVVGFDTAAPGLISDFIAGTV